MTPPRGRPTISDEPRDQQLNIRITRAAKENLIAATQMPAYRTSQAAIVERGIELAISEMQKRKR